MNIKQHIFDRFVDLNILSPVILEAGAAQGDDTVDLCKKFPTAKIISFEPDKILYKQAYEKIKKYDNVKLFNNALAETRGQKQMIFADRFGVEWGSGSLLPPHEHLKNNPDITFNKTDIVDTVTIQDVMNKLNLLQIDFMWLDMQGYEPIILMNSLDIIHKTKFIYSEINLVENYKNNILFPQFKKFMADNGFEIIYEELIMNCLNYEDGGNCLFENKNI